MVNNANNPINIKNLLSITSNKKSVAKVSSDLVDHVFDSLQINNSLKLDNTKKLLNLSYIQKIKLNIFGKVRISDLPPDPFGEKLSLYVIKCPIHGLQLSYPTGWRKVLKCSECY